VIILAQQKYYCPVCKQEYNNSLDALQCPEKYGYPEKPKYKKWQIVQINNNFFRNQKAKIIDFAYSQPAWLRKPAHKPTYLLILPSQDGILHLTTAWEEELKPI